MPNYDDNHKLITFNNLKSFADQIKDKFVAVTNGIVNTLTFKKTDSSPGVTVGEDDNHNLVISTVVDDLDHNITIPVAGNTTAATLENDNQDLHVRTLRNFNSWMSFPGVRIPAAELNTPGYLGEILTTDNFGFKSRTVSRSNNIDQLYMGYYNIASGSDFDFRFQGIPIGMSRILFTFVDLTITGPADTIPHIEWNGFTWIGSEPNWTKCLYQNFIILIIGNKCIVLARSGMDDVKVEGDGNYRAAADYAASSGNTDRSFMWLLTETDDNYTITKPIWHVGAGRFIDAFGCTIEE